MSLKYTAQTAEKRANQIGSIREILMLVGGLGVLLILILVCMLTFGGSDESTSTTAADEDTSSLYDSEYDTDTDYTSTAEEEAEEDSKAAAIVTLGAAGASGVASLMILWAWLTYMEQSLRLAARHGEHIYALNPNPKL